MTTRAVVITGTAAGHDMGALAAVRSLAAAGYEPVVTVHGPGSLAAASRYARRAVQVAPVGSRDYVGEVRALAEDAAGLLAVSDAAIRCLGLPGSDLVDKQVVADRARAVGLPVPPTAVYEDGRHLLSAGGDLPYPVVIKVTVKERGGVPVARTAHGPDDLAAYGDVDVGLTVQPLMRGTMRAVTGVVRQGQLLAVTHQRHVRTWPVVCGDGSYIETTAPDLELERAVIALLGDYDGIFQVELVDDVVLDVNPRVYGSLALAVAAGVDLPVLHVAASGGQIGSVIRARPGVRFRWLEGDVRHIAWLLRSRNPGRWPALRGCRPRRGTVHPIVSVRDPAPAFARLRAAFRS